MNALHQSTAMAHEDGFGSFMEITRMAPGLRTGRRSDGSMDFDRSGLDARHEWPGRTHGIRAPELFETALSWAEVRVALAGHA